MIEPKNLLIVRTDRIGDLILSLPMAQIVKKHYPACKVTFLVRNYTKDLLADNPFIDDVIILQEDKDVLLFKNISMIKNKNYDSCIIVNPTFKTSLILFLSGIKNRIGTGYRLYSFLFNRKVYEHRKYAEKHELEFNISLLKKFGIEEKVTPDSVEFNITVDNSSKEKIKSVLKDEDIDLNLPLIIIHPGSGGSAVDYPKEKFKELAEMILQKLNVNLILTGSQNEISLCEYIKGNSAAKNFCGRFSLKELTALINYSSLFISNSTGPLHIAAALDKHTIGFFPNLLPCSYKRWGAYSDKAIILAPKKNNCKDCKREQCSSKECMSTIEVTTVFAEVEKICSF